MHLLFSPLTLSEGWYDPRDQQWAGWWVLEKVSPQPRHSLHCPLTGRPLVSLIMFKSEQSENRTHSSDAGVIYVTRRQTFAAVLVFCFCSFYICKQGSGSYIIVNEDVFAQLWLGDKSSTFVCWTAFLTTWCWLRKSVQVSQSKGSWVLIQIS